MAFQASQQQQENLFISKLYEMSVATFSGKTDLIPTIRAKMVHSLVTGDWSVFRDIDGFKPSNLWKDEVATIYKKHENIVAGDKFAVLITNKCIYVGKAKPRTTESEGVSDDNKDNLGKKKMAMFHVKRVNGTACYDVAEYDEKNDHYKNLMYLSYLFMDQFLDELWKMQVGDLAIKMNNRTINMIETLNFLGLKYLTKQINVYMLKHKNEDNVDLKAKALRSARSYIKIFSKLTKFAVMCHNFVAFKMGKPINEDQFQKYIKGGYQTIYKFKGDMVCSHSTPNPDESYPILGFGVMRWECKSREKAVTKDDELLEEDIDFESLTKGIDFYSFNPKSTPKTPKDESTA